MKKLKKTFHAFPLFLLLLFAVLPVQALAEGGDYRLAVTARSTTGVTMELTNGTGSDSGPLLYILAAYDGDGRMAACASKQLSLRAGERGVLSVSYGERDGVRSVKGFVLDGETKAPLQTQTSTASVRTLSAEKDAELRAARQTAIDAILSTKTRIVPSNKYVPGETCTGKAYYVSASEGRFDNPGTMEKPWDLHRLEHEVRLGSTALHAGDAVFFKRGETFRLNAKDAPEDQEDHRMLNPQIDRLTFSAYGEGPKPVLTYSSENGSGEDKWKLKYQDGSGVKIWEYYRDMMDVGGLVCNDGAVISTRVYEYYDDGTGAYVSCAYEGWGQHDGYALLNEKGLLPLEQSMTENHMLISRPDRSRGASSRDARGPLYFRCDEGNPGKEYTSIEFSELGIWGLMWLEANNTVVDNLSFRSSGTSYIKGAGNGDRFSGSVIQNCEFGFLLAAVTDYVHFYDGEKGRDAYLVGAQGDAVYNVYNNATIRNNYLHDSPSSTGFEWVEINEDVGGIRSGSYQLLDNVLVNTFGLRLDTTFIEKIKLDSVVIRGNQLWNTGSIDGGSIFYGEGAVHLWANRFGECVIEDNLLYGTKKSHPSNALLNLMFYEDHFATEQDWKYPTLRRNTYVQHAGTPFAWFDVTFSGGEAWYLTDPDLTEKMGLYFGDTASEYYIIPS